MRENSRPSTHNQKYRPKSRPKMRRPKINVIELNTFSVNSCDN